MFCAAKIISFQVSFTFFSAPISIAEGTVSYSADSASRLSFKQGKKITIISKPKNGKGYWGAIVSNKKYQ